MLRLIYFSAHVNLSQIILSRIHSLYIEFDIRIWQEWNYIDDFAFKILCVCINYTILQMFLIKKFFLQNVILFVCFIEAIITVDSLFRFCKRNLALPERWFFGKPLEWGWIMYADIACLRYSTSYDINNAGYFYEPRKSLCRPIIGLIFIAQTLRAFSISSITFWANFVII